MSSMRMQSRIALASRFERGSAEDTLAAIEAARVRCLAAGKALVHAHYELEPEPGPGAPTAAQLIELAKKHYQPPRSREDIDKFWWDYLVTGVRRGIFSVVG